MLSLASAHITLPPSYPQKALRTCPVCRTASYFVTPSTTWPATEEEKELIVGGALFCAVPLCTGLAWDSIQHLSQGPSFHELDSEMNAVVGLQLWSGLVWSFCRRGQRGEWVGAHGSSARSWAVLQYRASGGGTCKMVWGRMGRPWL